MKKTIFTFTSAIISLLITACTRDAHFTKEDGNNVAADRPGASYSTGTAIENNGYILPPAENFTGKNYYDYKVPKPYIFVSKNINPSLTALVLGNSITITSGGKFFASLVIGPVLPDPNPPDNCTCHDKLEFYKDDNGLFISTGNYGLIQVDIQYATEEFTSLMSVNNQLTMQREIQ